ncbi:unnamed protein product [Prunus brigantina]
MKPKHGGPLWAFQFWLQAYFPELRGMGDLGLLYGRAQPTLRPVQSRGRSLLAAFRGGAIRPDPDGAASTTVDQPALVLEGRCLPSARRGWDLLPASERDVLPYPKACISARFIRPVEEAVRGALKNADLDPLLHKAGKGKKAPAAPSRPSTPVAAVPRVATPPSARAVVTTSTAAPTPRAPAVTGARKTLAHKTMPSTPPTRPVAAAGKPLRFSASSTEAAAVEVAPVESTAVETASSERPRKRVLLDLSEDEDEEEAPSMFVSEAPPMTDEAVAGEEVTAKGLGAEEASAAEAMIEVAAAEEEATAEVTKTPDAEVAAIEAPAAEEAVEDISDDEVSTMESPQAAQVEVSSAASAERTSVVTMPTLPSPSAPPGPRGIVFRSISCFLPHVFHRVVCFQPSRSSLPLSAVTVSLPPASLSQDSMVVTELAVVEAAATEAPSLSPVSSAVLTELVVADVLGAPSAGEETTSADLDELFASLHEEGGSSASVPLDEDSKAAAEKLREYLFLGVDQMTSAEAFQEFSSCLDTAMAMGLLDSAQLDELQARLVEGEEMIGRYVKANKRMTEGCLLEQELLVIKEQVQPTMASLKENDLVVQRENEELAQVEA